MNRGIVNKDVPDSRLYVSGFQNVELTIDGFASCIREGWAYCVQLSGDRRRQNFVASDIVSVDIDYGESRLETLTDPFIIQNAALLYTTVNHTEEAPRFRVVFIAPRTITDPNEIAAVQQGLALRLNGDRAATDPARLFFGNRNAEIHLFGGELTEELIGDLVAQASALRSVGKEGGPARGRRNPVPA